MEGGGGRWCLLVVLLGDVEAVGQACEERLNYDWVHGEDCLQRPVRIREGGSRQKETYMTLSLFF